MSSEVAGKSAIGDRLRLLISSQTPEKRRFPLLRELTGVTESTWRTWWSRGGVPSGALVEGAAKTWPEYAFWISTGVEDQQFGHFAPKGCGFPTATRASEEVVKTYFETLLKANQELETYVDMFWEDGFDLPVEARDLTKRNIGSFVDEASEKERAQRLLANLLLCRKLRHVEIMLDVLLPILSLKSRGVVLDDLTEKLRAINLDAKKLELPISLLAVREKLESARQDYLGSVDLMKSIEQ
ncbi:hypothetical protein ACFONG_10300 [Uliginosibacterium paludis]|uniref:Uncharacterized protein n=1 Tax=Uliginosibacterium paludis TaxID=1615952 RepID=A0ABV2CMN3_9RHOO